MSADAARPAAPPIAPLLVARHGQASFGSADYDRLSERGHLQARRLGDWLAGHEAPVARVFTGAMRRHRETAEGVAAGYAARGLALPAPEADPDLDEFDHRSVVQAYVRERPDDPIVVATAGATRGQPREVFALLQAAIARWAAGGDGGPESWAAFQARTRRGLARLHDATSDGPVLVLSSGGVIAQFAQHALGADDAQAIALNLALRNAALSEFHPIDGRLRLGSYNALPHLADDRGLWTYF